MSNRASAKDRKVWHCTEFAFPSADPCSCYRHRTRNGNSKRCPNRQTVIALNDPERPGTGYHRLYCLDCWSRCRDERTEPNPAQTRMREQQRKENMGLMALGC